MTGFNGRNISLLLVHRHAKTIPTKAFINLLGVFGESF
jgi:hypothetical protein